jgi:type I restriction enzyme S subunit
LQGSNLDAFLKAPTLAVLSHCGEILGLRVHINNEEASFMGENKTARQALVPKLRFPRFQGSWTSAPVSQCYAFKGNNAFSRDKLNYSAGSLRNIHYGDIHTKFSLHFYARAQTVPYINAGESHPAIRTENYCAAGDMVFADASENITDIGKAIEIIDAGNIPLVAGLHTILASPEKNLFALGFGAYLFASEYVKKQIQREAQGAKVLGLSASRLGNVALCYPRAVAEQQKITNCLSCLDDLITAQTHKLDTLKTHKKCLMQQLFPREGEAVPRLRFSEFQDAGKWIFRFIGAACESFSGGTPSTSKKEFYGGSIPFIRSAEIASYQTELFLTAEGISNSSAKMVRKGDVLVALYGANSGNVALSNIDGAINQAILCLRHGNNNPFVYQWLSNRKDWIVSTYTQGGQGNLSGELVKSIEIPFPSPEEQQKIVDCLSCLDDLITVQTHKLAALKTHKKALMQRLFSIDG